jgi:putative DNA primase/helicase
MEITERLPLKPIHWLSQLSYSEFVEQCLNKNKKHTKEECKTKYSILQQFCQTNLKTSCITKRIYSYSTGTSGRLFSGGSLQGLPSTIRGLFMRDGVGTDIDMCNAHPVILRYICKLHNIPCPYLEYYINHREDCLMKFESREIGKVSYLTALNKDTLNRTKGLPLEFKKYDIEIKKIQKLLVKKKEYMELVSSVPENKPYNKLGSAVNRIMCYYENIILQHAIHVINKKGMEIAILMFDGLMVYGYYYKDKGLLEDISYYVEQQMNGLDMIWTYKEHNTELKVPEDFIVKNTDKISKNENNFESVAKEFEKTHLKIINKSLFVKHDHNNIIFLTQAQLKMSYSHLSYDVPVYNDKGIFTGFNTLPFINKWIGFTHNIRRKDDVDIYPNTTECPENIFNLWRPFAMELLTEPYTHKQTELEFILNHIKILCNHDENVYDYFIKWIAQMVQYPHIKTIMPTFISGEGSGKGTLFKLFEKMLGNEKVFETTNPSRDVWGDFNGMMCNCFLVNLNELSKKDTMEAEGKIKGLITDNTLAINQKGIPQYKIKSYHRFITTTNKEEPINSTNGDRRNLIIRSSDEKKGDYIYFETMHKYLEDNNVIRTCYDYFKGFEGMDKFKDIPIPVTEYQTNLKELSKSPIEQWLESFTREHMNDPKECIELLGTEIYELFKDWSNSNGIKYDINAVKLGIRLTNLNISGISKGKHTEKGKTKIFNFTELKKTFNLGCLINL